MEKLVSRHALLFSFGRSIVVHGSRARWQGVCVCVLTFQII